MNKKRAANRSRAGRIAHREPEHQEKNYRPRMAAHQSYGSPASIGASKGSGPVAGTDQLPGQGPGSAAKSYAQRDPSESPVSATPPGTPPRGMSTYSEE